MAKSLCRNPLHHHCSFSFQGDSMKFSLFAAVLLILSGCAVSPHGPDVSGSVAIGPHGIYAGNVSVGSSTCVVPAAPAPAFIFPAFPMPLLAYPPHPHILPPPVMVRPHRLPPPVIHAPRPHTPTIHHNFRREHPSSLTHPSASTMKRPFSPFPGSSSHHSFPGSPPPSRMNSIRR